MIDRILIMILFLGCIFCQSSEKSEKIGFSGFYVGIEIGSQVIFGGSYVNGIDILAQDSRFVTDLIGGWRTALYGQILFAVEFHYGFTDGDLSYSDNQKQITYSNSRQLSYGLDLAYQFTDEFLLLLYANETKRKFAVEILNQGDFYKQTDKQGMIRYGIGFEYKLYNQLNIRSEIGLIHADFHDLITNIDAGNGTDVMIGLSYQLY